MVVIKVIIHQSTKRMPTSAKSKRIQAKSAKIKRVQAKNALKESEAFTQRTLIRQPLSNNARGLGLLQAQQGRFITPAVGAV